MNSYLLKFKEYFEYMYNRIRKDKWFTNLGTSIEYYIEKFKSNQDNFINREIIDLNNEENILFFKDVWLSKKPKSKVPYRQFMSLLVSLNIYENIKSKRWKIKNSNLSFNREFYINQWSRFNNTYTESKGDASALRIIYGFLIYSVFRVIGVNDFKLLCDNLDEKISKKLIESYFTRKVKNNHLSYETTYSKFYDKYFSDLDVNELIKIFDVIKNGVDYIYNDNFDEELENNFQNINNELTLINKKVDLINKICEQNEFQLKKETIRSKITKIVRYKFSNFLKNEKSHFYIENKLFDKIDLTESAHIISVQEIVDKIIDNKYKNKDIEKIIKNYTFTNNGIQIPFNYHKLYDMGYINFSKEFKSFEPTEKGRENIDYILQCGFNRNNKFTDEKSEEIKNIVNSFLKD